MAARRLAVGGVIGGGDAGAGVAALVQVQVGHDLDLAQAAGDAVGLEVAGHALDVGAAGERLLCRQLSPGKGVVA